ncbi:hypothetical protein E4T45_11055 [Aureobasidium sp. EXF-8846]|nr:hypothetical protein E4T45_11055 [Aureobasidium sp. EXF-8846]
MAFFFTCGTHTFNSLLQGYENIQAQCQNCGNFSARVYKRWEWFTLCFIVIYCGFNTSRQPIIPFSLKPHHEVGCHICNFYQDIMYVSTSTFNNRSLIIGRHRPDVQQMMNNPQSSIPMQPQQTFGAPPQQYKAPQGPPQYV